MGPMERQSGLQRVARLALAHACRPWTWEPVVGVNVALSGNRLLCEGEGGFFTQVELTTKVRRACAPKGSEELCRE